MRRYRLKHGKAKPVTKPVTKPSADNEALITKNVALHRKLAATEDRNAALEKLLDAALRKPATAKATPSQDAEIERLKGELADLKHRIRYKLDEKREAAERRAAKAKPALDPDSEAARQIKGLLTRVRNLTRELARAKLKHGHMNFETESLIAKALHPEAHPGHKQREEAYKAFNAWKSDAKAAARKR